MGKEFSRCVCVRCSRKPGHSTRKVSLCRGHVNSRQPEAEEQSPRGVAGDSPQDVLLIENTVGARLKAELWGRSQ